MLELNFTPFPILETERLLLRPLTFDDAQDVFTMRNDAELNKYTGGPRAHVIGDAIAFIERITKNTSENVAILWGIMLKGEKGLAGSICLWNILKEEDQAELGYGLLQAYQGKGIMQEALQAVLTYGFETMKLKIIEACTDEENGPSRRLLVRNGFSLDENMEAKKAVADDLRDMLIYLLKPGDV